MIFKIVKFNFFILLNLILFTKVFSNTFVPGTPSSSYNFNYNNVPQKEGAIDENREKLSNMRSSNNQNQIIVQGNSRLETSVIIRDSKILELRLDNNKNLSKAIKNLYKTGYFENVQIYRSNNSIVINVKENPIIDLISIEGNSEITDDLIMEEIELKSRSVFSTDKIKSDVKKIQNLYKRQGFFSTFVEPKFIKLTENRVNLIYDIMEGKEAKIRRINFVNNMIFSDSTLKDVISSTETRWYEFWGSTDKFDQDRINYDKDLLRKYYLDNGYVDFEILSVNSSLVNNRKEFVINFTLKEGERYIVENVSFRSSIRNIDKVELNSLSEIEAGDWFSSDNIEKSISNIIDRASELGFAFVDVLPKIKKIG